MNPVALDLGFIQIYWYSIIILFALFIGGAFVIKEGERFGISEDFFINLMFWGFPFSLLGARLYYVAFNFNYYKANPIEIIKIWEGGLAIHGAIIVGLLWFIYYSKKNKVHTMRLLDISAVGLLIGQSIGRWGNFMNQEAYGGEVTRRFLEGLFLPNFIIEGMHINGAYYHPTFLYESLWTFIGFIILIIYRRYKYLKIGELTGLYFMWYSLGRFFIEAFRTDSLMFYNFRVAQIVSVILFIFGLILFIVKRKGSRFENLYREVDKGDKNE
jgi:phosphatidylglycerol:prolipoprotein diacylglycerol transferase